MKQIRLYIGTLAAFAFVGYGCNDSESDMLKSKLYFENNVLKVEVEADSYDCEITSRLSDVVGNDVSVTYQVGGQELVDEYNQKHGITGVLMPTENYKLNESASVIKAGDIYAAPCGLTLKNISKGDLGTTYILPVVVNTQDISKINSTSVTYIAVKKPVVIDKVYEFSGKWLNLTLPTKYKTMGSMTMEALVYATRWKNLGTIMGNEGELIMRTGDLKHPDNELQMAGKVALQIPDPSILQLNTWYHVAYTYDAASGMAALYVNGEKITDKMVGAKTFDLSSHCCIGYAYDYDPARIWYGSMSEVRLWEVARSANQLRESMMYVDPKSEGLVGYWKLNGEDIEKRDNVWYVRDQSPNGNDATSNTGRRGDNPGVSQTYGEPKVINNRVKVN